MKKPDPEKPKLTQNEQKVLKKIISEGRVPDTVVARDMRLSQQAIYRIRNRLESLGIIKGYTPVIDFKKIGIHLIQIVGIKLSSKVWNEFSESEINEKFGNIPYIFQIYRLPGANVSYILVMGFRDIEQRDNLIKKLETKYSEEFDINWMYECAVDNMVLMDPTSLLYSILDKKEYKLTKLF